MRVAFLDESGSPSPADGWRFFVVAVLVTSSGRAIELHVKRARRTLRVRSPSGELKAAHSRPVVIKRLLRALAEEPCEIYAVIVDKQGVSANSAEDVYQAAVARAVLHCVRAHPNLHLYLDRRYTNRRQSFALERTIRQTIASVSGHIVVIEPRNSAATPGLQAVDFVAWALTQKYGRGETWAREIVAHQIKVEELVKGTKIAASPGGR